MTSSCRLRPISRRKFLVRTTASAVSAAYAQSVPAAALDSSVLGANTAMYGFGLFEAIQAVRELGFPAIEIHPFGSPEPHAGMFPGFQFDRLTEAEKQRIREALAGFRHVTVHLPYIEMHLFSRFAPVAEFSARQLEIAMDAAACFKAGAAVAHITPPTLPLTLDDVWPTIIRQFRRWGDFAARSGFNLSIETGYPNSVRDFVRLVKEIDHDAVGATVDVGHQVGFTDFTERLKQSEPGTPAVIATYNDVMHEIIDQLSAKVFHLHVHDVDPRTWKDHRPLGAGGIAYPRLLRKLKQIGYSGLLIFELDAPQDRIKAALTESKLLLEKYLSEI